MVCNRISNKLFAAKGEKQDIARLMLDGGKLSYEDIAAYTELTIEEVEKR